MYVQMLHYLHVSVNMYDSCSINKIIYKYRVIHGHFHSQDLSEKNMLGKYMINHMYQYNNGWGGRGGRSNWDIDKLITLYIDIIKYIIFRYWKSQ